MPRKHDTRDFTHQLLVVCKPPDKLRLNVCDPLFTLHPHLEPGLAVRIRSSVPKLLEAQAECCCFPQEASHAGVRQEMDIDTQKSTGVGAQ